MKPDVLQESFSPYGDPALRYSPKKRLDFICRLQQVGLIGLRKQPRSFIGAFFVKKKDPSAIRKVLDCRGSNRMHHPPPVTRLGSSPCYADLRVGDAAARGACGFGREADVNDAFYNFSVPDLIL